MLGLDFSLVVAWNRFSLSLNSTSLGICFGVFLFGVDFIDLLKDFGINSGVDFISLIFILLLRILDDRDLVENLSSNFLHWVQSYLILR